MIAAFVVFFALVIGLTLLPLLPAILEWRRPTDTAPLSVAQHSEVDIRYLANRFRTRIGERLAEPLERVRETGRALEGELDGRPFRVVPAGVASCLTEKETSLHRLDRMLLACGDLRLPDGLTAAQELYAEGSVVTGAHGVYRAILATGDVTLGTGSRSLRWIHADGSVRLGPESKAHGRVSADHLIRLVAGAEFERLRARRIEFGTIEPELHWTPPRELPRLEPRDLEPGTVIEVEETRWLVNGDCEIPPDVRLWVDLVVTGRCRIRRGAELAHGVKSHGPLTLEDGVRTRGALVSAEDVTVGERCHVEGPIVAEGAVEIGTGSVVGDPDRPTTVTGLDVTMTDGTVVHGTVWAHRAGLVAPWAAPLETAGAPKESVV